MSLSTAPLTLTVSEIRGILRIGAAGVYNLIHSKSFPVRRIGIQYRIPAAPFYQWLGLHHPEFAGDLASKSQ